MQRLWPSPAHGALPARIVALFHPPFKVTPRRHLPATEQLIFARRDHLTIARWSIAESKSLTAPSRLGRALGREPYGAPVRQACGRRQAPTASIQRACSPGSSCRTSSRRTASPRRPGSLHSVHRWQSSPTRRSDAAFSAYLTISAIANRATTSPLHRHRPA
jgi:hypothetical protein